MKGTRSFGKHNKIVHIRCRRCGRHSFHERLGKCSACGYPRAKIRKEAWRWKPVNRAARRFIKPKHQKPKTKYIGRQTAKIR
ncbi:MAG: 50S ribosomal protein L37e [Candidatus Aenigmarchaeota archaeon]|nr:50S ribosomal protein L37e [Candidatus Aenigmarchaeota archaeon]